MRERLLGSAALPATFVCLLLAACAAGFSRPAAVQNGAAPQAESDQDPHRRRSTLYVSARGSDEVIALSRDTGEVLARIPVASRPSGLAARADGDRIYVACSGAHSVQVIDGATRKVLDTVALPHGAAPSDVALSPDEKTVYVAATGLDAVYALDAGSLQQTGEAPVGREPTRLALSPDGRRLYALAARSGRLDIVDATRMESIASPTVGTQPTDMALDESTGTVYVVRAGAPALHSVAEGASQAREIALEAPAEALAVEPRARRLWLAAPASGRILQIVTATGASTISIQASEVSRLAVDPEGSGLYALSARRGTLLFVNRIRGTVERTVHVGKEPWDLVLIP